jgi:predicted RNA-binding Zn ribbon-like protein
LQVRHGMEPGRRRPAPPPVRFVQEFLNSSDALTARETLNTPSDLERWMRRHALDPGPRPLQQGDLARALRVREAIRTVATGHNGRGPSRADIEILNGEAAAARWRITFGAEGRPVARPQGSGVTGLVAALLSAAARSEEAGIWDRLKACPACGWAFFDHSRNRRGQWCTMSICGSRAKMRAFRARAKSVSLRARPGGPGR